MTDTPVSSPGGKLVLNPKAPSPVTNSYEFRSNNKRYTTIHNLTIGGAKAIQRLHKLKTGTNIWFRKVG